MRRENIASAKMNTKSWCGLDLRFRENLDGLNKIIVSKDGKEAPLTSLPS